MLPWDTLACLIQTEQGLYVWTSHYFRDGHLFYPLKDQDLWIWI